MNLSIINPVDYPYWNESLLALPDHSFFHTQSWAGVLQKSYNYKPVYFTLWEQAAMKSLLPVMEISSVLTGKRGVSLPFTDYCEPIVPDAAQFQEMFNSAIVFGKKQNWKYLEFRGGEAYFQNREPSEYCYGHTLDLTPGSQKLFSNLRDSTRRNIKRAQKENVRVTISTSLDSLKDFYRLNAITRRDHGLPPQPWFFFKNVYDRIISSNLGFIAVASFNNAAIAANLYFYFGDKVIYKYGASDRAHQHFRVNNLVMWEAIRWSCDNGYTSLCFGRTEPENEGLRQFKTGWDTREHLIKYYKYDFQTETFIRKSGIMKPLYKKIFNKLPVPALNILGTIFYRHMG